MPVLDRGVAIMADLVQVEISDFKGIQKAVIELQNDLPRGRFITLIGLNESGKTTILEAMALSALADEETVNLFESVQGKPELNNIIPKRHKAAFSGDIRVDLKLRLTDADKSAIHTYLRTRQGFSLAPGTVLPDTFFIQRAYNYRNSTYQRTNTFWTLNPRVKKINGSKVENIAQHSPSKDYWPDFVAFIKSRLPRIVYFPTFLIDFPNRIYLEGDHGVQDRYFRGVIDDALKSLEKRLTIAEHIIGRVNSVRRGLGDGSLGSALRGSAEGQNIDATVQELTAELNFVIFGAWNDIFGRKVSNKRINVEWHIDEGNKQIYLELYVVDGKYRYYIGERSLGFRWFFSFLLFTQFSTFRNHDAKVIYLFDEPASNLHAKAQQRLLESFQKIADPDHIVVYSTHSHYMINPQWLEKAFIVENLAINADEDDLVTEFLPQDTNIKATRYRAFVNANPTRTTYFQPALDALDHCFDPLSLEGPALITEGKYDFFLFVTFLGA